MAALQNPLGTFPLFYFCVCCLFMMMMLLPCLLRFIFVLALVVYTNLPIYKDKLYYGNDVDVMYCVIFVTHTT